MAMLITQRCGHVEVVQSGSQKQRLCSACQARETTCWYCGNTGGYMDRDNAGDNVHPECLYAAKRDRRESATLPTTH